jgi:hypothetical protein
MQRRVSYQRTRRSAFSGDNGGILHGAVAMDCTDYAIPIGTSFAVRASGD